MVIQERYINPFTDFGFKRLFGTEANKDLLIDFLNELLAGKERIHNLTYLNSERLGKTEKDRKSIYDIYCENEQGEKFIVELQNMLQVYFKDRSLYYSTSSIQEQAPKGDWDFELKAVYTIGILNFELDRFDSDPTRFIHRVKLSDIETKEVFYDKLTYIYLEMPKFTKTVDQLETRFDKWLYVLKNLHKLQDIPKVLQERIFKKLFETAEIANYNPEEMTAYEESLKTLRDNYATNQYVEKMLAKAEAQSQEAEVKAQEAEAQSREAEAQSREAEVKAQEAANRMRRAAKKMKEDGLDIQQIMEYTDLSRQEIKNL